MLLGYRLPRLKFSKGEQRKFVEGIFEASGLNANALSKIANVSPRTIRDWKREEFYITEKALDIFCKKFDITPPENKQRFIDKWKEMKIGISRKGGLACFRKYGSLGTPEGRRKGGSKTMKILRERGIIPLTKSFNLPRNYSTELAEWVGIVLGDGSLTSRGQAHITLNLTKDASYRIFVSNLGKKLFGEIPRVIYRTKENTSVTYYSGVKLIEYLINIGLKIGNKVKQQVDVPDWVKENDAFCTSCLRGLIDTDGCIGTHSYFVNGKRYTYKNLVFANRSIPLVNFVHAHLNKLGLGSKIADKLETKYVWLYNYSQTKRYLDIVGTHNSRILTQGG